MAQRKTKAKGLNVSLINASDMVCVAGFLATVMLLKQALEGLMAKPDANQTRVPHSDRIPEGSLAFLSFSCLFHSALLTTAKPKVVNDVQQLQQTIHGKDLQVPVYATTSEATNRQTLDDALEALIDMQLLQLADWPATLQKIAQHHATATHILDFGPDTGVAKLSSATAEGLGIQVIIATAKHEKVQASKVQAPRKGLSQFLPVFALTRDVGIQVRPQGDGKLVNLLLGLFPALRLRHNP